MSRPARFSPAARREFLQAIDAIEDEAAADRLRRRVEAAVRRIGSNPALGRHELSLARSLYRFWSVSGFPYLIVYRADLTPPAIVRFVHTARDLPRVLAGLRGQPPA